MIGAEEAMVSIATAVETDVDFRSCLQENSTAVVNSNKSSGIFFIVLIVVLLFNFDKFRYRSRV